MYKRIYAALVAAAISMAAAAAPIDTAKKLYQEGQYDEALTQLQALHKKSPRDGNTAYYLGATLVALDRTDDAVAPLKVAASRGVADASRMLAEIALDRYRPDEASGHLDEWEAALRKNKKARVPESLADMQARALAMRNMMERVERIEILDSLTVDADQFFRHYRLSPEAGRLLRGSDAGIADAEMVYRPQGGRELLWAEADTTGTHSLMGADILDDGTIESMRELHIDMEATDMSYPFMMPDGATLYFAAQGPESLGGYDIFMTRRNDDGEYLQPQNVGMPYNSPANDYMLAIDEAAGIGWWATDRNAPEGKVTIYEFVPSAMRVNVAPDAPDIADRARITSIAATQEPGKDYDALRRRAAEMARAAATDNADDDGPYFEIAMGDGSVYTTMGDFRNPEARRAMENLLGIDDEIRAIASDLDALRAKYRAGNDSVGRRITGLEAELDKARARRRTAANKVVRLESLHR